MILGSNFPVTQLGLGPPLSSRGNQNHPDVDMTTITLGILEQQQSPRGVGERDRGCRWLLSWVWRTRSVSPWRGWLQEISGSKGGLAPLRVSGLKGRGSSGEEGPGVGLSGEPLEGRRKGTRDLWQRQLKGPLGCKSLCVLFYF